jgi:enediyne biosynthesis protein E4
VSAGKRRAALLAVACGSALAGCDRSRPDREAPPHAASPTIRFTDVTPESGIDFVLTSGTMPSTQILEVKGHGLALIDFNNNGSLDLFVPNGATLDDTEHGPGWRLYENLGEMRFRDVTEQAGIRHMRRWALGAAVADFDGDGFDDLYVACFGPNVLLRNSGDGRFDDVTERAGAGYGGWSTSAAFGDISGDGWLDLYVANYLHFDPQNPPPPTQFLGSAVLRGPHGLAPQDDALFLNRRDGTLEDISESSGIRDVTPSYGLGVVILDFDDSGRQDIYVGNDSMPNFLFRNEAPEAGRVDLLPRMRNVGVVSGIASNADGSNQATMGIALADVNGNNLPDVFTTNFSSDTNTLHVNVGDMLFEDQTQRYGLGIVSRPFLGWACGFYDLDLDSQEELFMVNGHVFPQATRELMDSDYEQPPLLFKRRAVRASGRQDDADDEHRTAQSRGRFVRVMDDSPAGGPPGGWLHTPRRDRAVVFADLDGDGDIDMVIAEMNGPIRVLRNDTQRPPDVGGEWGPKAGHWLIVELHDSRPGAGNRRGLGSRVELHGSPSRHRDASPPHRLTRWIHGGGFMSSSAHYAHFGFPRDWTELHLRITWPDGAVQDMADVSPDRRVRVLRTN